MEYQYTVIDAFSSRPFRGNPDAVVLMSADLSDDLCQSIASEFNMAETAFVQPLSDGKFGLRWFTPTREVPLCGHATLASAHALWQWSVTSKIRALYDPWVTKGTTYLVRDVMLAGVKHFLTKPYTAGTLLKSLRKVLDET